MATGKKYTAYGGQAVIEGVMMKGPEGQMAVACRRSNGEIVVKYEKRLPLTKKYAFLGLPILRGVVSFIDSLVSGVEVLNYSAELYGEGADGEESLKDWQMILAVILALVLGVGLFMVLPTVVLRFLPLQQIQSSLLRNLLEGCIRILFFLAYVTAVSYVEDIRRVFQYHGAEHKTIHCYEAKEPLTVENVRKYSTLHPRCGTNFLFIVMVVASLFFSLFGWPNLFVRVLSRLLLMPLVAGISYEVLRYMGKHAGENRIVDFFTKPGLWLQKLTTREPDDSQMEVAIRALQGVLPPEEVSINV